MEGLKLSDEILSYVVKTYPSLPVNIIHTLVSVKVEQVLDIILDDRMTTQEKSIVLIQVPLTLGRPELIPAMLMISHMPDRYEPASKYGFKHKGGVKVVEALNLSDKDIATITKEFTVLIKKIKSFAFEEHLYKKVVGVLSGLIENGDIPTVCKATILVHILDRFLVAGMSVSMGEEKDD